MLTRPKVIVPDQNGRVLESSSEGSGLDARVRLGNFPLLPPPGGLLSFQRCDTLRQIAFQRGCRALLPHCMKPGFLTFRLGFDELDDSIAILVAKLFEIEVTFERADQL